MKHTTRVLVSSHDNKQIGANPDVVMRLCPGGHGISAAFCPSKVPLKHLFPSKIEESDLTSEVENVDLVILHQSVRSVPRNSHFARPTSHQETEGTEKKKEEETDSLEDGQTASLATPNAHPCSQE